MYMGMDYGDGFMNRYLPPKYKVVFINMYNFFIFLLYIGVQLIYNAVFQVYSKVIQLYTYIYIYIFFFKFLSHLGYYRILSSFCANTVGPHCLSILSTIINNHTSVQ